MGLLAVGLREVTLVERRQVAPREAMLAVRRQEEMLAGPQRVETLAGWRPVETLVA